MDINFSQGHPIVLGQHRHHWNYQHEPNKVEANVGDWASHGLEGYNVQCDLILLFTEESMKMMNSKLPTCWRI